MPDIIFDKGTEAATGFYLFRNPLLAMQGPPPPDPDDYLDPTVRLHHASTVPISINNMRAMHAAISRA